MSKPQSPEMPRQTTRRAKWPAPRLLPALLLLILAVADLPAQTSPALAGDLSRYAYQDTRELVVLVDDAAALVEAQGEAAFAAFGKQGSRWLTGDTYLFIYSGDGTAVFHPISPELVGQNLISLRDIDGKPIIEEMTAIGQRPEADASGWVFYHWQDRTQLTPIWKASYVRKAVAPDGKIYLVGSGLYDIKVERTFIEERVKLAAGLLARDGKEEAFARFADAASPFTFLGTYVFVLDATGKTLVDPAFPNRAGRDMADFRDAVGIAPIKLLLEKLAQSDEAWVQFLWPKPGEVMPSRKLLYARKVVVNGETLIVGSDFFIATPIWMKVERDPSWPQDQPG